MPLSLDIQGFMAIDIGFFEIFHILCERGTPKDFSELHLYALPTLPPPPPNISTVSRAPSHRASRPASPCQLGATVSQVKAGKLPITYTQAHKHARKRKRISSSYNIMLAKPA